LENKGAFCFGHGEQIWLRHANNEIKYIKNNIMTHLLIYKKERVSNRDMKLLFIHVTPNPYDVIFQWTEGEVLKTFIC